jgi:ABC-type oligopeptide transport system substrate-binding subunit
MKTICRKRDMGVSEFLKTYGPDTTLKIRKLDGKTVTLNFKKPTLKREPMNFLGVQTPPDPLLTKA